MHWHGHEHPVHRRGIRPRRLYTRIYAHVLLVLVVVGMASGGLFSLMFRTHTWRAPAERLMRRVAGQLAERVPEGGAALDERTRRVAEDFDADVTVRDLSGRRLAAGGDELPPLGRRDLQAALQGTVFVSQRHGNWFVAGPILDRRSGQVQAVLELSLMRRLPVPNLLRPVAWLAGLLALVALLTLPLSRRISRPVERLTEANRRFGRGDLTYRIPLPCTDRTHRPLRGDELLELLRSWNEMAERIEGLVRGQKELLANVSHELRSPLARIRVALALVPEAAGEAVARRLRDVEQDLGELERLIDDVLTTARLETMALPVHRQVVEVRPLLEGMAERGASMLSGPGIDRQGADVRVQVDPALDHLLVEADPVLLKRALWNLVENALKYGAPPVTLSAHREGDHVVLAVSDEGSGIDSTERQRVLEAFYRVDKAHTPASAGQPGGHGLGLTLARRIAEVHGGSIGVTAARNEQGREIGCRVALRIPALG